MDMKPASQPKHPGCSEKPKSPMLPIFVQSFLLNVINTRALIGISLLVTSHRGQIRDLWDRPVFTIAHGNWSS